MLQRELISVNKKFENNMCQKICEKNYRRLPMMWKILGWIQPPKGELRLNRSRKPIGLPVRKLTAPLGISKILEKQLQEIIVRANILIMSVFHTEPAGNSPKRFKAKPLI